MRLQVAGPSEFETEHASPENWEEAWELQGERLFEFIEMLEQKTHTDWSKFEFSTFVSSELIDDEVIGDVIDNDERLRLFSIMIVFVYLY